MARCWSGARLVFEREAGRGGALPRTWTGRSAHASERRRAQDLYCGEQSAGSAARRADVSHSHQADSDGDDALVQPGRPKFAWGWSCCIRRGRAKQDESVAALVERHFGPEAVDRLADPLLSGIFGGDATQLSARTVLPKTGGDGSEVRLADAGNTGSAQADAGQRAGGCAESGKPAGRRRKAQGKARHQQARTARHIYNAARRHAATGGRGGGEARIRIGFGVDGGEYAGETGDGWRVSGGRH